MLKSYRAFHRFGQAKFAYGGPILPLPQLPQKITLASKVVNIDSKIIISSCKPKSVTHSVLESVVVACRIETWTIKKMRFLVCGRRHRPVHGLDTHRTTVRVQRHPLATTGG